MNIQQMMKQAQQMQEKMAREMKETTVEASAGGGAVSVKMRGDFEVLNERGRRALRVHLGSDVSEGLQALATMIMQAVK